MGGLGREAGVRRKAGKRRQGRTLDRAQATTAVRVRRVGGYTGPEVGDRSQTEVGH